MNLSILNRYDLKKLRRLSLAELRAINDHRAHACPNTAHLATAIAKLEAA